MSPILKALEGWFTEGFRSMGEVAFTGGGDVFVLNHVDDVGSAELQDYRGAEGAREIARLDDKGNYRPLRTAPNLKHGWRLHALGWDGLREALDGFYPAALGSLLAWQEKRAEPVSLRETLGRQTGMYAFAGAISDGGATELVEGRCGFRGGDGGCVRKILWELEDGKSLSGLPPEKRDTSAAPFGFLAGRIPIVCLEACNLLVASARKISRSENQKKETS